jgi:hypothetical protein
MRFLLIKVPKGNEHSIEQTYALLANLVEEKGFSLPFLGSPGPTYSLEIIGMDQKIYFVVGIPDEKLDFFEAQLLAQFKEAVIGKFKQVDELNNVNELYTTQIALSGPDYLPIKTEKDFEKTDPLSSILATMAKSKNPDDIYLYQLLLAPASKNWQYNFNKVAETGGGKNEHGDYQYHPKKHLIERKTEHPGFKTYIRLLSNKQALLNSLAGSFGVYTNPSANSLTTTGAGLFGKNKLKHAILNRETWGSSQIMNVAELASLWHLPSQMITLPNIAWGRERRTEAPEDLPAATGQLTKEQKKDITFIGRTNYKNELATFGIKRDDRPRHVYSIGKTGTGKSTLIANMAIEDIRKGKGVAVIDPHGDLIDILLDYIPSNRINQTCYFNPADREYAFPLNPLEVRNKAQQELVASGIVSIFHKLYGHSWGPRMEHILRNTLLTLTAVPNTTLEDIIKILTEKGFRQKIVNQIEDDTLKRFWTKEFASMSQDFQSRAVNPILNKVGQFVTSPLIREVVNKPKSKINIEQFMDEGKILLCDLSQGKIGEDNSSLLGAMIITQIQLAAMNRVYQKESERKDFYLFVDEFQNFATKSFIKILSEARKYKLNLTLANQYMAQLDRDISDAILGNVGTLISFTVGAQDAHILTHEFGSEFDEDDLVSLGKFEVLLKLCIDGQTSNPFYATTLPLPDCDNQNRDKIIRVSRERFGTKTK